MTTETELQARIQAGGGDGWQLPEDFDWKPLTGRRVDFVPKSSPTNFFTARLRRDGESFLVVDAPCAWDIRGILAIRLSPPAPTSDAIDAMRQLSALRKGDA